MVNDASRKPMLTHPNTLIDAGPRTHDEQGTPKPLVGGSIPSGPTNPVRTRASAGVLFRFDSSGKLCPQADVLTRTKKERGHHEGAEARGRRGLAGGTPGLQERQSRR